MIVGPAQKDYEISMATNILPDRKYTKDHEWALAKDKSTYVVGITDFAQTALGDVTYVQLPEVGKTIKQGEVIGSVESVKAVSDIYAPMSGKVAKVNSDVMNDPSLLNQDPYGKAWLIELELSAETELTALLSSEAYSEIAI